MKSSRRNSRSSNSQPGINWDFVDSFDVEELTSGADKNSQLKCFIKGFRKFQITNNYSEYRQELMPKFLRLCQLSCNALIEMQVANKEEIQTLKDQYNSLQTTYDKARLLINKIKNDVDRCPICRKMFKSAETLQNHIQEKHPQQLHHWNCLFNNHEHISTNVEGITNRLSSISNSIPDKAEKNNVILPVDEDSIHLNVNDLDETEKPPSPEIRKIIKVEPDTPTRPPPRKKVRFYENSEIEEDSKIETIPNKNVQQMLEDDELESTSKEKVRKKIKKSKKTSPTKEEKPPEPIPIREPDSPPPEPVEEDSGVTFIGDDDDISFFKSRDSDDGVEEPKETPQIATKPEEDGLLQTTFPLFEKLEFFDNNPESSYLENGNKVDEASFVDEEPPLRF